MSKLRLLAIISALAVMPAAARAQQDPKWMEPIAPFKIADRLYYVGSRDLGAFLIDSGKGLILLDTGVPESAPRVIANIRTLGFDPKNIRILLNTQSHFDHAGGLAALKAASGARMLASRADARMLEAGGKGDFHMGDSGAFPAVEVDGFVSDGQRIRLGPVTMTAHLTPGHTRGCTTWTMPVSVKGKPQTVQFNCSTTVPGYKLIGNKGYPEVADDYRRTFAKLRRLPCDIFLGGHGSFYDLDEKRAKLAAGAAGNPFIDPTGCARYLDTTEKRFNDQLAREHAEARSGSSVSGK